MLTDIFITTPCLNAVETIDQTIQSVVSQAGPVQVHYHVQDGGSSDGTWERILWWQEALSRGDWPVACAALRFSCDRAPDRGLYDAIVTGFATLEPSEQGFLAWINADDIYLPGTFAFIAAADRQFPREAVSWVGGGVSVIRDDMVVASHDRELPTGVVRAGLCDDLHWRFVQQEGSFFRGWLWDSVTPEKTIRPMKLAGDWNLWRLMAERAELVQAGRPLASFRVHSEQLSATQAEAYQAEIESLLPGTARQKALVEIASSASLTRLRLESRFARSAMVLVEEAVDGREYTEFPELFGAKPFVPSRRVLTTGHSESEVSVAQSVFGKAPPRLDPVPAKLSRTRRSGWLQALDVDWQFPAITEEHALRRLEAIGGLPDGLVYVAYPWATLIDHLQAQGTDSDTQLEVFEAFCAGLPETGTRITVCQHVLMRRFKHLFRSAGIEHIFWPHATKADLGSDGPQIHPFPLYPVQLPDIPVEAEEDRPYLYSFIGARANPHYLTDVRSWILDQLGDRPEAFVRGREDWHYAKVVYHHQIWNLADGQVDSLVDDAASREFRDGLSRSIFALCPSGSGSNSIRLWEALGAGAIPVILSDDLALPGDPRLWEKAAVFCRETPEDVAALPERLGVLSADPARLDTMRRACRQLWDLYGPDGFVTDILELGDRWLGASAGAAPSPALLQLARNILADPRPDPAEAELLLTLVAGSGGVSLTDTGFAANVPLDQALARSRARLGRDHPACHTPYVMRRSSIGHNPAAKETETLIQSLFPGALRQAAQAVKYDARALETADYDRLVRRRDAALAASDYPDAALLSDHHLSLYRLFLNRDEDMDEQAWINRWSSGVLKEWGPADREADWPDPELAKFSSLYGACRIVWSATQSLAHPVEAAILGAIPASPAVSGLGHILPDAARIDLSGLSRDAALDRMRAFSPDPDFAAEWISARAVLRRRLSDAGRVQSARRGIVEAVLLPG